MNGVGRACLWTRPPPVPAAVVRCLRLLCQSGLAGGSGLDLPGICGVRLAHFSCLPLEGDGALEAER